MLWTVLILALAGADVSVPADFEDCRAEALSEMAAVGIFEDQVRGVVSYPREDDSYDGMIVGYDVSVHLYTCSDRVYINFDRHCRARTVYAVGDCEVGP
ncbi:MAG: hypothetical protein KDA49_16135 [Rhodospirillaceae bacterium]|nr:hypothetical protein [Rhodospirillaceae bacterium]MCA8934005.1 hypothetical protein [Rhodospirillaceae bacterium]